MPWLSSQALSCMRELVRARQPTQNHRKTRLGTLGERQEAGRGAAAVAWVVIALYSPAGVQ